MNLKKRLSVAALLAIILGSGLGYATYSLIAETPAEKTAVKALDLYAQQGGLGTGEFGGVFEQNNTVRLSAYLTIGGVPINRIEVTFKIRKPDEQEIVNTVMTDDLGNAKLDFTLPTEESALGNWSVSATATVKNEIVSDSMILECQAEQIMPPVQRTLDLYTQQGGFGPEELFGGVFAPGDVVRLSAYLTGDGVPIVESEVTFITCQYAGIPVTNSALTDSRGIAEVNFTIPSDPSSAGNWTVSAVAYFENETVDDSVFIGCETGEEPPSIFALIKRNGELCVSFNPLDSVTIAVRVYCEVDLLPLQVKLEVMLPNGTYFLNQSLTTDMWGGATTEFQIPMIYDALGTWSTHVSFEVGGQRGEAYNFFDCEPPEPTLDVFTQRGGQGQNVQSGPFLLGENVSLCAVFRVMNSSVVAGKLVSFEAQLNGATLLVLVAETNSSGIASVSFRVPPDPSFVGPWEVYARLDNGGMVLLDTLVFAVEQPQG